MDVGLRETVIRRGRVPEPQNSGRRRKRDPKSELVRRNVISNTAARKVCSGKVVETKLLSVLRHTYIWAETVWCSCGILTTVVAETAVPGPNLPMLILIDQVGK